MLSAAVVFAFVSATAYGDAVIRSGNGNDENTDRTVYIGVSFDMSKAESRYALNGATLAIAGLNESFGTDGIVFALSSADDGGDPDRFSENVKAFCENGISLILCDGRYAKNGSEYIALSPFVSDSFRSLRPGCAEYGKALAEYLNCRSDIKSVTVLRDPESIESLKTSEEFENALDGGIGCVFADGVGTGLSDSDAVFITDGSFFGQLGTIDALLKENGTVFCTDGAHEAAAAPLFDTRHDVYRVTDFVTDPGDRVVTDFVSSFTAAYGSAGLCGSAAAAYDGIRAFYEVLSDEGIDLPSVGSDQLKFIARSMREQSFRFRGVSGCGADTVWNGTCFEKKLTVIKVSREVLS